MFNNRTRFGAIQTQIDGGPGPPATLVREPGQIRKEAATADDVCAGMWLGPPPICVAESIKCPIKSINCPFKTHKVS